MTGRVRARLRSEQGSVMVITLAFLSFAGLVVSALLTYSTTSLRSTNHLASVRGTEYDADGAIEAAIARIRPQPASGVLYQGYVGQCDFYRPPASDLNNPSIRLRVDCFPKVAPFFQREVLLRVCRDADPMNPSPTPCSDADSLLNANVKFYDDGSFGRAVSIDTWSTAP